MCCWVKLFQQSTMLWIKLRLSSIHIRPKDWERTILTNNGLLHLPPCECIERNRIENCSTLLGYPQLVDYINSNKNFPYNKVFTNFNASPSIMNNTLWNFKSLLNVIGFQEPVASTTIGSVIKETMHPLMQEQNLTHPLQLLPIPSYLEYKASQFILIILLRGFYHR